MSIKVLYFANATQLSAKMAKQCRDCSYRKRGFLADCLSDSRKGHIKGKIAVVYDQNKQMVIGWGGIFHYSTMELMVYVKTEYRRQGYGTKIVKKLLSKIPNHTHIIAFKPECDINNDFYLNNINDRRIMV